MDTKLAHDVTPDTPLESVLVQGYVWLSMIIPRDVVVSWGVPMMHLSSSASWSAF
jgi:hypothetical protein